MNNILMEIAALGLANVKLLALVTDTSYDVVFYADVEGGMIQSNTLAEQGKVAPEKLAAFYEKIAECVRSDPSYDNSVMNVVKVDQDTGVTFSTKERDCRVYAVKKEWRNAVLGT